MTPTADLSYSNPKSHFLAWLFGPLIDFLIEKGISLPAFFLLLYTVLIYFKIFKNRKQNTQYAWNEKFYIGVWFVVLAFLIVDLILGS